MAGNDAFFTNMKVPELRKFLKERGIQISVNGKSRKRAELLELCKNAAEIKVPELEKKTEQCDELITLPGEKLLPHPFSLKFWTHDFTGIPDFRIPDSCHYLVGKDGYDEDCLRSYKSPEGFCLFTEGYVEDLKYHDLTDAGTDKPTGYCYFQFIVLSFESFFSMNFVFIKDVAVIIQSNFSRNTDNLGVKYSFAVFVSVSFSPLIRPFFALTWTSTDCKLIKYCWNRAVCQPFSSRKCLHDFFSLKVFGAYMQVLDGRELLISATTEGASFLS